MSVMTCGSCDRPIDTDYNVEAIEVWGPDAMCDRCFESLNHFEVWNLALKTVAYEMKHMALGQLEVKLKELSK